ncbi:hypothetical protein RvY_12535-1 [Ramazzottius varieornatus]|uniref:Cation/H+ exchanger transmembrane domain-containing protein n=1 Tax=Ramazzottius varieornatus TaxID=947166 RepID=A0A1D1VQA5_RAMVA|nr:hypothetical protein RvY_12535-1 [Ramazzottius varieornatus]
MVGMSSAFDPPNEKTSLRLGEAVAADDIPAVLPIGPSSQNGRLSRISPALHRLLRPLVKSSYPCPDCSSSTAQRLKYHLLLPPSGIVARLITLLLLATLTWAALWSLFPAEMLRKSSISGLYLLLLAGLVAGWLVERIKLAPLLGMLIVGVLFRNVYPIDFAKHIDRSCSGAIRNIALAIILTRAGLGLEQEAIKKRFWAVMSLAIVPTLSITAFITLVGHYMNGLPWLFSAALGFLISAVSPAVIVPILLVFQEEKLGQEKGLPSLLIAAAIICDVIAICGNSICLGIALSNGNLQFNIAAIFLTFIAGIGFGLFAGWILTHFPAGDDDWATIFRFILLVCTGLLCIFGSKAVNLSGAGALAALIVPMVAGQGWRRKGCSDSLQEISVSLKTGWFIFQPLLFGLIGAAVDVTSLQRDKVGLFMALLFSAHALQLAATYVATCNFGFNCKENLFLAIGFLPKATIQAAIGSTALDIATKNQMGPDLIQLGTDTLNCAVLAILFFAPIGGVLLMATGRHLLDKPAPATPQAPRP